MKTISFIVGKNQGGKFPVADIPSLCFKMTSVLKTGTAGYHEEDSKESFLIVTVPENIEDRARKYLMDNFSIIREE